MPPRILRNRYRIEGLIDQGGFGAIYKARDLHNQNRARAVKENLDNSSTAQQQFQLEAQLLRKLDHPNLPKVSDDFIEPNGQQYLVMDFIAGEDLRAMVKRTGPLQESQALAWITQICDALTYLHSQSVIHRDVKPANIRITPTGKAVLVDFGIAKIYDPTRPTTLGARGVTPGFSPPEQYGRGKTDARSDVYALGATLYAVLTGQEEPVESVQRTMGALLSPPRSLNPALSVGMEKAILRAMETDPSRRFQTMPEMTQALLALRSGIQPGPAQILGRLVQIGQPALFSSGYGRKEYWFVVEIPSGQKINCHIEGFMPLLTVLYDTQVRADGTLDSNNVFQVTRLTDTQRNQMWTPKPTIGWVEQLKITLGVVSP
jgi:serine/threonine-protein kinase